MEVKSSGLAIVLSFVWPGLGQLYAGHIGRGIGMMLAAPVLWIAGWSLGLGGLGAFLSGRSELGVVAIVGVAASFVPLAFWGWGMVDSRRLCERFNRRNARALTAAAGYVAVSDSSDVRPNNGSRSAEAPVPSEDFASPRRP